MGSYLPRWTKRAVLEGSGRDPLGLSRVSDNFTELLLPSIITTTNRARYCSFYPWALRGSHESLGDEEGTTNLIDEFGKREAAIAFKLGKKTERSTRCETRGSAGYSVRTKMKGCEGSVAVSAAARCFRSVNRTVNRPPSAARSSSGYTVAGRGKQVRLARLCLGLLHLRLA